MKQLTRMQRAERWYNQQVKAGKLRDADHSSLSKRMSLCYEPAQMLNAQQQKTLHDHLQELKLIDNALKIKL